MADCQRPDQNKINIEKYMRRALKNEGEKEGDRYDRYDRYDRHIDEPFNYSQSEMEEKSFEEYNNVKKLNCYKIGDVSLARKDNSARENLKLSHYILKKDYIQKESTSPCKNPCCNNKIKDTSKSKFIYFRHKCENFEYFKFQIISC